MDTHDTGSAAAANAFGFGAGDLGKVVARRPESLFTSDVAEQASAIRDRIKGARILVVGGGGTIGSSTVSLLFDYHPKAVWIVDLSENYLVEVVRSLRGRPQGIGAADLQTIALDYGSPIMSRMLANSEPFDIVMNFAALKHVRSEKDVYSLLHMLNTNVVAHIRFKEALARGGHGKAYFAVSTDKAANPSSLMGASKRLMEDVAFDVAAGHAETTTSARFANVAFSNGSLLQGWLQRLSKGQPIAAPRDTRRYFVTEEEAGQLCLLASMTAPDQHIAFPRLDPEQELQPMQDVATRVLRRLGYEPELFDDEVAARNAVDTLRAKKRWPLLLTPLDTSGEKPFEEFIGAGESAAQWGLKALRAVGHAPSGLSQKALFSKLDALVNDSSGGLDKASVVEAISAVLPTFSHKETGRSLDDRL